MDSSETTEKKVCSDNSDKPSIFPSISSQELDMIEPTMIPKGNSVNQIEITTINDFMGKKDSIPDIPDFNRNHSTVDILSDYDRPDYRLLTKYIEENHPRNKFLKPYGWNEACCDFSTGWHKIRHTSSDSDLDKFGVGIVLYFRFLKYLACFFLLFAILSAPSLYFAIKASEHFEFNGLTDYKGILYFTTMGSLGRGTSQCTKAGINERVLFSCEKGTFGRLSSLQYGRVLDNKKNVTCSLFTVFSWDDECNNENQDALNQAYSSCQGMKSCELIINSDFFDFSKPKCQNWSPESDPNAKFYFKALCENVEIELPSGNTISKKTIGYIAASCDAVICILYVIMLVLLKGLEKDTVANLEENVTSVDGYTIKVSNLPEQNRQELRRELWKHFGEIIDHGLRKEYKVVDVQLAESQYTLDLQLRLGELRRKKIELYKRFFNKWSSQSKPPSQLCYEDIHNMVMHGTPKMFHEFKTIRKLKEEQDKVKAKLRLETSGIRTCVIAAYVTFETKEQRDDIYAHYQKSSLARLCYAFCPGFYKKDVNICHDTYLKVKEAPKPDDVLWPNLDLDGGEKFLRRLVSWLITAGFWALSFTFMVLAKHKQEDIANTVKPTLDCSLYTDLTIEQVEADKDKDGDSLGLYECYCRDSLQRQIFTGLCRQWSLEKGFNNALPFLIVIGIILTNYALQYVFKLLSRFERHQSISSESTSRVIKIFVAQVLNTGVIILIVNARFSRTPLISFFSGNYDDFIPEWYLNVGTTLLTTMIINIVNLPVVNTLSYLFKGCFRCCDRNCTCDERKTCKETQTEWQRLYTGPEFLVDFRYAQFLTVIFICFIYSSGLPLLYLTTFLNLVLVYWMDKLFLLKICRLPKMFDQRIENIVRRTLYLALFFHLAFAIWIYGNPELFGDNTTLVESSDLAYKAQDMGFRYYLHEMGNRVTEEQNIVLTVLICLFVVAFIAIVFFHNTANNILMFCFGRRVVKVGDEFKYQNHKTYFDCIRLDDLILEKTYLEKEIVKTVDAQLKVLLTNKLERIIEEINKRDPTEESHLRKFVGIFSYFIGHNPVYKPFFDTRGHTVAAINTTN